jgi:hypothetical protein
MIGYERFFLVERTSHKCFNSTSEDVPAKESLLKLNQRRIPMTDNCIIITFPTFASFQKSTQEDILRVLQDGVPGDQLDTAKTANLLEDDEDEDFAELSLGQAREFYSGCGEKTRKAIEVMARSNTNEFHTSDVAKALGVEPDELRGVWGGLTRRTQTVMNDKDAYLINWQHHDSVWDEDDKLVDHIGVLHELTHQSFRRLLVK